MSVITFTSRITKRREVTLPVELLPCKHGIKPKLFEIFTGRNKKNFQGASAECGNDECLCFSYTAECAAGAWNIKHTAAK